MKKWPEAETLLKKAIEADPENAVAHNNLGVVLNQKKKYEMALKKFQLAHSLDPQYQKASQNIMDTQKLMERAKKTIKNKDGNG